MRYRSEIDGLRAIAVLPVVFFHAGLPGFEGGFIGVDIFFVISGYLITGILLSDMAKGQYSIIGFYERRARRILPALFAMLAAATGLALWLLLPGELEIFSEAVVATVLFVSNFQLTATTGYFAGEAENRLLLHTWSLAVEEQFYIFFPLILWLLWRHQRQRLLAWLVLFFVVSLLR